MSQFHVKIFIVRLVSAEMKTSFHIQNYIIPPLISDGQSIPDHSINL